MSNTPVLLYPGRLICQLVLMRIAPFERSTEGQVLGKKEQEEDKPDKNYFGPVYPEAPKFNDPQKDLFRIGVTRVSRLKRTREYPTKKGWREIKPGT